MSAALSLTAPVMITFVLLYGLARGTDVFSCACTGAKNGMDAMLRIFPSLICLLPAVYMLRASGAPEMISKLLAPLLERLGVPPELSILMVLRPISGSAALAAGTEMIAGFGPDSFIGRAAAVLLSSTETTFYVIAVYFGAAGVKRSRHAIPAALCADLAAFIAACWASRLFFP